MFRAGVPILLLLLVSPIYCAISDPLPFTTTTDAPETTTNPAPTTTTPSTTTPATTTSATTTTTSTAAPPTPIPVPPEIGNWNVTDKNNITCLMIQATIKMSIEYTKTDNKTGSVDLVVPINSVASGTCDNETQSISISWAPVGLPAGQMDKIDIVFTLNTTTKSYHVTKLTASVYPTNFPGAAGKDVITLESKTIQTQIPPIPLAMSYRCTKVESFNLTGNSTLEITQLQLQAFHAATDNKFGAASDCEAADSADIVPIVVGCALAALVVIVLIAYLVGRRRSRQSGYLSM
ncbi:lysosome-associated membrane glycoprotein 1 [Neocloeon triangulifer]|uniref:lysosome-associated membrane glycoprotein 1 n=1 Tax=Neocloeon triangulifer TaxID=2078957 RepID=UPI00286F7187|nr:lysosome-associated membrane glycoprotein 1 [Neocloeon triangulifer]